MANFVHLGNENYQGLSTDTKPTNVPANATAYETDTYTTFKADGSGGWTEISNKSIYDYLIYPFGALNFKVRRGSDGKVVYTSNNPTTADALGAFQYCRDQLANTSPGGVVQIAPGFYPLSATFTLTGGTHGLQKYIGPGNGSALGVIAQIRASGNYPAITLDGQTASLNGIVLEGLYLSHNTSGYSNGLIRIIDAAVENTFVKLAFNDFGQNVGDCFKIEILNTSVAKTQYSNKFSFCITRGFDNFININNQAPTVGVGSFMASFDFTNCSVWGTKRVLNVAGVSGAQCLDFKFSNLTYQYIAGNAVSAGQGVFNYDSVVSCWAHKHTNCQIWDITAPGINYANVGSGVELSLIGCSPTRLIAGSGISTASAKIFVDDWEKWRSPIPEYEGKLLGTYTVTPLGDGLLLGSSIVGTPVQNVDGHGPYLATPTGTTANTSVGIRKGPFMWRRDNNMYLAVKGSANNSTLARYFVGWSSASPLPGSDTILATTDSGFLVGFRGTTDTNFQVFYNNGGGSAMTVVDTGIPISNSVENLIILTSDSSQFTWSIGTTSGAAVTSITTGNLPAASTTMVMHAIAQNNSTTSISYNMRWIQAKLRNLI